MSSKKQSTKNSLNASKNLNSDVQNQLKEFYSVAKEKLLTLKKEVENSEKEYETQKEINQKKDLDYKELVKLSKELDLRIKGLNEKLINSKKMKKNLENQIKEMKSELSSAESEIDYMKIETDKKVQDVQNAAGHINVVKQNQVISIQERIKKEQAINEDLKSKIEEAENKIKEITVVINEINAIEGKKNDIILEDAAEMNKFLSEI
jgi:chromosome segregation ATPase